MIDTTTTNNPLNICFVASEVAPFAKTGGLADVSSALPLYLFQQGHDIRVFMPLYGSIERSHLQPLTEVSNIPLTLGSHHYAFSVYKTAKDDELPVYFIDCAPLYQRRQLYTNDVDEHLRFAVFCQAVLTTCQYLQWAPNIFHCNDWQTGLLPIYLQTLYLWDSLFEDSRTLLSIHNIGYQGIFPSWILSDLGLINSPERLHQEDMHHGHINFLKTGLLYASKLSTVSPTYAEEICTAAYGMGLESLLLQRHADLIGILNGVDYDEWSPQTDPHIPYHFSAQDLSGKEKNKQDLLAQLHLKAAEEVPLLGVVSRLASQKGFDLLLAVLPEILQTHDIRLIVLGSGEPYYEAFFEWLQQQYPDTVCFYKGFNNELAHRIEAASDIFLMPSLYEPCGLNQMYSLKYGTIPVVRKTGGLADTVKLFDPASGSGTGVVFDHYDVQGLHWGIETALAFYHNRPAWQQMQQNAMAQDFSWQHQGAEYVELYRSMMS